MPIHDWSSVDAGVFHDFHHGWIEEIKRALNGGLLPPDYYALAELRAPRVEPDILTLQHSRDDSSPEGTNGANGRTGLLLAPPKLTPSAESDLDYYRRKQSCVAVRHASGDRLIAVIEVVSRGNKSSRYAIGSFVEKSCALLDQGIHLLILDLQPPGPRDPNGIHGLIWEEFSGQSYAAPPDKPLTLVAYEARPSVRAFVVPVRVGDTLPDMPLLLEPDRCVEMPVEATYEKAWRGVPRRWRDVIDPGQSSGNQ
jgi:hypothetical protein